MYMRLFKKINYYIFGFVFAATVQICMIYYRLGKAREAGSFLSPTTAAITKFRHL